MTDELNSFEKERESLGPALRAGLDAGRHHVDTDLADVLARQRSYRRRTWVLRGAAGALLLAAGLVNEPSLFDRLSDARPAVVSAPDDIPDHRAATFALRAIAQAGLMDPLGSFYGYEGIERQEDEWVVWFASSECVRTETTETCHAAAGEDELGNPQPDTRLSVGVGDDGNLRVVSVERSSGPVPEDNRERLLAYSEWPDPVDPHPEFAPIPVTKGDPAADGDSLIYRAASYWAGPIPEQRTTFGCFARAFDEGDQVVYESHAFTFESPEGDSRRNGGVLHSGFPADTGAQRVEMVCDRFRGPGWSLASEPEVRFPPDAGSVRVIGDLVWEDRGIIGIQLQCTTSVLDANGQVLGEVTQPRSGPWPLGVGEEPPFRDRLDVIVDVAQGSDPSDVRFDCVVPSPPRREPDDSPERPEPANDRESPSRPPQPPKGPRHVVAEGTFEGTEWGELTGQRWWLYAWQVNGWRCWSHAIGEPDAKGRFCTRLEDAANDQEVIGGSGGIPSAMHDSERSILYGELDEAVARIEIQLSSGRTYDVPAIVPEADLGINARYFVAFVEPSESYSIAAYDGRGKVLQKHDYEH